MIKHPTGRIYEFFGEKYRIFDQNGQKEKYWSYIHDSALKEYLLAVRDKAYIPLKQIDKN